MHQISAEQFRQRLAGVETPEAKYQSEDIELMKKQGVEVILAMREVFGHGLDRKTIWERIVNGIMVSAAKAGGKVNKFISALLEYVKADVNVTVGNARLSEILQTLCAMSVEYQRMFINTCVEYRMTLALEARAVAQEDKLLREQTGAKQISIADDGTIVAKGEAK